MNERRISGEKMFLKLLKNPIVKAEYDAQAEEFALARTMIAARARANMTQSELADRIGTTQSTIARWESGSVKPSTRTLERIATATDSRLKIVLEPLVD